MASATDTFDRANGAIGSDWSEDAGDWDIDTNAAVQRTESGAYYKARYTATPPATANHYSEASVRSDNNARGVGVIVRAAESAAVTDYRAIGFGGDAFYIVETTAGAETILDTGSAMAANTDYTLRITANGTSLTATVDGSPDMAATDATLTSGGWGIGAFGGVNPGNSMRWNSWSAADLAAPSTQAPRSAQQYRLRRT